MLYLYYTGPSHGAFHMLWEDLNEGQASRRPIHKVQSLFVLED